ncbi:MAG: hypothetical protein P1V97_28115, partial [Planctomycetota bacterium]|nr:hypothetical protein [Planctomycetota bacterium]
TYHTTDENGRFSFAFICDRPKVAISAQRLYVPDGDGGKKVLGAWQTLDLMKANQNVILKYNKP